MTPAIVTFRAVGGRKRREAGDWAKTPRRGGIQLLLDPTERDILARQLVRLTFAL